MDPFSGPEKMEKRVSHKVVLPCAVQCLLGSLDICFIELFWCQAIKIKLVTAKVWPKGGPKSGSVLRRQKWSCKNKYIISAYDSGRAHFWGHETDPKGAPLFCPQSFAERCCDGCFFHWSARHGLQNASRHEKNCKSTDLLSLFQPWYASRTPVLTLLSHVPESKLPNCFAFPNLVKPSVSTMDGRGRLKAGVGDPFCLSRVARNSWVAKAWLIPYQNYHSLWLRILPDLWWTGHCCLYPLVSRGTLVLETANTSPLSGEVLTQHSLILGAGPYCGLTVHDQRSSSRTSTVV